jgi:hypothetical protein
MEMHVQQYLRSKCNSLESLNKEFGIEATLTDHLPLVRLNYCQINSDKRLPIVQECRALMLELDSWNVVGRSFPRFFNAGECPDIEKNFKWHCFDATHKEDGSLKTLSWYKDNWVVCTRGSFAKGKINDLIPFTWEECFYKSLGNENGLKQLDKEFTYSFEYCSPYNKVVRKYEQPTLFLLAAFQNADGLELSSSCLDEYADALGVRRPYSIHFNSFGDAELYIQRQSDIDRTFEGLVLKDKNGMRLKVKSKLYVALHRLHNNGNICSYKNLLPLLLNNEGDELITYFPEYSGIVCELTEKLSKMKTLMLAVWEQAKDIQDQKEFALYINKYCPQTAPILFTSRKQGRHPMDVWLESESILLKRLT